MGIVDIGDGELLNAGDMVMANDAKLGLMAGVASVLLIAVAFNQKKAPTELPVNTAATPAHTRPAVASRAALGPISTPVEPPAPTAPTK